MHTSRNHVFVLITISLILLWGNGCTPSLVYSPSLHLPPSPPTARDVQASVGLGWLPEARPQTMSKKLQVGDEFFARYTPFSRFTMEIKGWREQTRVLDHRRSGWAYTNIIMLTDSTPVQFSLIPTIGGLFSGQSLEAGGGIFRLAVWFPQMIVSPYSAVGVGVGINDIRGDKNEWGWGYVVTVGADYQLWKSAYISGEVNGIGQINKAEHRTNLFFAPSLQLGVRF